MCDICGVLRHPVAGNQTINQSRGAISSLLQICIRETSFLQSLCFCLGYMSYLHTVWSTVSHLFSSFKVPLISLLICLSKSSECVVFVLMILVF